MADLSLDLSVLRMLKRRKNHERYAKMLPEGVVNDTTRKLVSRMGEFFAAVKDEDEVTFENFWPFLRSKYPKWKDKDVSFWESSLKPIDKDNPEGYNETVLTQLLATDLGNKALALIEKHNEGDDIDLGEALRAAVERYEGAVQRRIRTPDVELDWDDMIAEDTDNRGLQWRLTPVARAIRALREGDFGIIAMRPDRGKTTWVASEVSHFAPQLAELYPDEFATVLWLNNEGPGRRILGRIRQSALGMSVSEIAAMGSKKARELYAKAIGGEARIQVKDIHGFTHVEVEELIRKLKPRVVVFDMIDNIHFVGGQINNGERTDQILEAMYQWARSLAVRYGFVAIATSQVSAEGDGERYPRQTQLKDSRTGKQGACDFILTGGYDPNMPRTRFIGTTKNKLKVEGSTGNPAAQVWFDADRARLQEAEETE